MRYRKFLVVLLFISMAVVISAEPIKDVSPHRPPVGQRIGPVQVHPGLVLKVFPKGELTSTEFVLKVAHSETEPSFHPLSIGVRNSGNSQVVWLQGQPRMTGENQWSFLGSELQSEQLVSLDLDQECIAVITRMDPEATPFARGMTIQTLESRPVLAAGR